jgi:general secretion pathway protein K
VRDGSHCISLGALGNAAGNRSFRQLLTSLGWNETEAARITTIAIDWQDSDSQTLPGGAEDYTYLGRTPARRAANTAFGSVTELRELDVFSEKQYQTLRPFLCSRDAAQELLININTLSIQQAPLLAAVLGGPDALNVAAQLITQRPANGFADITALRGSPALAGFELKNAQLDQLSFEPVYLWVEAQINFLTAQRISAFEFVIDGGRLERIYHGFGAEALRPQLEDPDL